MRLHINIDHVATVRQARRTDEPDPVRAAVLAELGGADGITVHLREDRRHIQDRDLRLLIETVRTGINLELAPDPEMLELALELRPKAVTLVPERREEITTEGGLALTDAMQRRRVGNAVERLLQDGQRVALFVDPVADTVRRSAEVGAHAVELHTGEYAQAGSRSGSRSQAEQALARLRQAAALGRGLGLDVHAGHGLTYDNVTPVACLYDVEELNIGHSVISHAVFVGLERAVRELKDIVHRARVNRPQER